MDARKRVVIQEECVAFCCKCSGYDSVTRRDATRRDVTATSPRGTGIARNSPRGRLIAVSLQLRRRSVQQYYLWFQYHVSQCQWLEWSCEAGGSPDEARLEQTPYPFPPNYWRYLGIK